MRANTIKLMAGLLVLAGTFGASEALADDQQGETGPIRAIHLRSMEASISAYWNWVVIAGDVDETYYWGGSVCPGKNLRYQGNADTLVDALAEYATYPDMCITPFFKNGQGGNRCLVAFTAAIRTGDNCDTRPQ